MKRLADQELEAGEDKKGSVRTYDFCGLCGRFCVALRVRVQRLVYAARCGNHGSAEKRARSLSRSVCGLFEH